jgi:5-methylcytosine-specific restriction endonuclease McrA
LDLGPAPGFTGAECADCGRHFGLEYDHVDPVANRGPTTLANLQPRCWPDHQAKTERDREAGLLGPSPPSSGTRAPTRAKTRTTT